MPSRKRPSKRKSKRQGVSRKKCKTCSRSRKVVRRRSSNNLRGGAGTVNVEQYIKLFKYTAEHRNVLENLKRFSIPDYGDEESEDEDNYGYIIQQILNYYNISKNFAEFKYIFAKQTVGLCKALNNYILCYNQSKIKNLIQKIDRIANKADSMSITDYFNLIQGYKRINKILRNTTAANYVQPENTFDAAQHKISEMYSELAIRDKVLEFEKTRLEHLIGTNQKSLETYNVEIQYRGANTDHIQNTNFSHISTVDLSELARQQQEQVALLHQAYQQNDTQRRALDMENEEKRRKCKDLMATFTTQRQVVEATVHGYIATVKCPDQDINLTQFTVNINETTIVAKIVNVFEQVMLIYG